MNPLLLAEDFNMTVSEICMSSNQKINKDIVKLSSIINQLGTKDIYRPLHPTTREHTFFSSLCGTFTKLEHILDHKAHPLTKKHRNHSLCHFSHSQQHLWAPSVILLLQPSKIHTMDQLNFHFLYFSLSPLNSEERGLPWWPSGEESALKCTGCGFDPLSGN